jgi:hypothetical protein
MEVGVMKARPPHVRFKLVPVEDRTASIEAGHPVYADVPFVVITPQGSKDSVEKPAKDWLETTDQQVREERLPAEWAEKFHSAFAHWKRGEEMPVEGSALANWPVISPAQLAACKSIHVMTIEDLALLNDEGVRRLGMGGLGLKQLAKKYLDASAGPGKLMAENAALQAKNDAMSLRLEEVERRMAAAENQAGIKSPVVAVEAKIGIEEKL